MFEKYVKNFRHINSVSRIYCILPLVQVYALGGPICVVRPPYGTKSTVYAENETRVVSDAPSLLVEDTKDRKWSGGSGRGGGGGTEV